MFIIIGNSYTNTNLSFTDLMLELKLNMYSTRLMDELVSTTLRRFIKFQASYTGNAQIRLKHATLIA
jgi:hypothetical protein